MARLTFLHELIDELVAEREEADCGVVTGIPSLDRELGGKLAIGLHVIQAAPGDGKTALAAQIGGACGAPALFVTAEMRPVEVFRRCIARITTTALDRLAGAVSVDELRLLAQRTAMQLSAFAVLDATLEPASRQTIVSAGIEMRSRTEARRILVVLDSLQWWARGLDASATEYEQIVRGIGAAREVALELGAPVLVVSHRSRSGQKHGGMHASKGSGDVEYGAETLLELAKEVRPDSAGEVAAHLMVLKNRHGSAGAQIALRFSGRHQTFREVRA